MAGVHILDLPYDADRVYDYRIPDELKGTVETGDVVAVPFGMSSRGQQAVVARLSSSSEFPDLKEIIAKCGVSLPREMTGLCDYMKEHFFCSYGEAARVMAPTYAVPLLRNWYLPAGSKMREYGKTEREIIDYVASHGGAAEQTLVKKFGLKSRAPLRRLAAEGALRCETRLAEKHMPADERVSLCEKYRPLAAEELRALVRGEKQKEVLEFLSISGEETLSSLYSETGAGRVTVKSLEKNGFVRIIRTEKYRDPYAGLDAPATFPVLSGEQKDAADRITALCESGKPACALLYGVTGSGKTSVIGQVIDSVIESGRQVVMLVPEISLTPQAVKIFYNRYPGRVAVLHSGLSDGERFDAWNRIRRGGVSLCIGTRSAVFAPFQKLGLIVMDEEQDGSYKSDSAPRFHARDVARYRCANENAVLLLSSATPSLGSFMNAKNGVYTLVTLKNRYGSATLPHTVIADMRKEAGLPPIGEELKKALSETLERKEQAILFINRRGYHSFLSCTLCGKTLGCPHCSVTYTYHVRGRGDRGYLYCHYCGSKAFVPSSCQCGGKFRYTGVGTQQVEDEITRLFPSARVLRLDSDTTSSRFAY
ncbi:MAG: primosomal protein N', partial [Clostridia bacterium]|nr:primosomal protein N' [Clostridia bacterium]